MGIIKLDDEELEAIAFGDSEQYTVIEDGDWVDEGKYSYKDFYFKDNNTGLIYAGGISRSGSYFSDYTYNSELCNDTHELHPLVKVKRMVEKELYVSKPLDSDTIVEV